MIHCLCILLLLLHLIYLHYYAILLNSLFFSDYFFLPSLLFCRYHSFLQHMEKTDKVYMCVILVYMQLRGGIIKRSSLPLNFYGNFLFLLFCQFFICSFIPPVSMVSLQCDMHSVIYCKPKGAITVLLHLCDREWRALSIHRVF